MLHSCSSKLTSVVLDKVGVYLNHLFGGLHGLRVRSRRLEIKVVLAVTVEFGGSNVGTNKDLALVTSQLNGLREDLDTLFVVLEAGSETTLIADTSRCDKKAMSQNDPTSR
jgi:hypothetical protein